MLKWCFLNREKQSLWMFVSEMFHKMSKIFGRSDADGRLIKLSLKINLYPLKMKGSVLASNSLLSIGKICSLILVNWNVLGKFRWNSAFFLHKFFTTAVTMFSTVFRFARGFFFSCNNEKWEFDSATARIFLLQTFLSESISNFLHLSDHV